MAKSKGTKVTAHIVGITIEGSFKKSYFEKMLSKAKECLHVRNIKYDVAEAGYEDRVHISGSINAWGSGVDPVEDIIQELHQEDGNLNVFKTLTPIEDAEDIAQHLYEDNFYIKFGNTEE